MTKGKTTLTQKDPSKGTAPNNHRPITCLPMMWKILTAQIREKNLLFANKTRIVSWRTERMPQRIQKHSKITLHRSTHPKWEQDKTEKSSYGLDWLQEGIWYAPTKLDIILSQNVQNITWSDKLHRTDHEYPESGDDSRRKKHSWNKDPKRHLPRRCTMALTIHNSHDATEPHTQKMHCRIQARDHAIRTNHIKARIDKSQQNSKCRLCGDRDETINHIISECRN